MLSDVFFPRVNGVSTSIQTYRSDLQALGHQVTLVAPRYPSLDAAGAVPAGVAAAGDPVDTVRIGSRGVPRDPLEHFMLRGRSQQRERRGSALQATRIELTAPERCKIEKNGLHVLRSKHQTHHAFGNASRLRRALDFCGVLLGDLQHVGRHLLDGLQSEAATNL